MRGERKVKGKAPRRVNFLRADFAVRKEVEDFDTVSSGLELIVNVRNYYC